MTDYSRLQSLFTDYAVHQNVERGYNGAKVESIYQAIKEECARLNVTVEEGRRLAAIIPGTRKVEVTGPAHVLTDGNEVRQFATEELARASRGGWQPVGYFVPAGETRQFAVAA